MNKIPTTSQASLSEEPWFIFRDGDRRIAANGSWFTGRERVLVNDSLISKKRSWNMTSNHQFIFEEDVYEVVFYLLISTGNVKCFLTKNGICIGCLRTYYPSESSVSSIIQFFSSFILGGLISSFVPLFGCCFPRSSA